MTPSIAGLPEPEDLDGRIRAGDHSGESYELSNLILDNSGLGQNEINSNAFKVKH